MGNKFNLKNILGNSMWQIGEKIITMLIGVIVTSIVARYLGVEQYGLANYIISIVALFTALSTFGTKEIIITDIVKKGENKKEEIIGSGLIIRLVGGILLIIASQIAIYILTKGDFVCQVLGIIMGTCMLFQSLEVIEYYFQAAMQLKLVAIIRFISTIIAAMAKLLVVYFNLGIVGFVSTYLVDAIIVGVLLYIYYKSKNKNRFKVNKEYVKELLKKCWYIALSGLMTTIYMRIDQVMLGSMLADKSENGIYSAATRIAEMWYFVPLAIITVFQPVIVKRKEENNKDEYKKEMQRLYDIVAIIGIAFGIIITLFGWLAVDILYGPEYKKASSVLYISVWAGLFATLGSARFIWLIAENKQKYTIAYTVVGCIINIILNYILIPKMGAFGAALATLITQFVSNIFVLMFFDDTKESSFMILKAILKNNTIIQTVKDIKNRTIKN